MIEDYFDRCFKSERLKQKKVYIFGVSILAIAVIKYLRTHGMFVSGFSDFSFQSTEENLEFSDTRIFMPKTMKGLLNRDCIAVVACTRHSEAGKYRKKYLTIRPFFYSFSENRCL